jgi:hypothetical protein
MRTKTIRRGPILFVLAAALAAAIVYDGSESSSQAGATRAGAIAASPAVPRADALSTSWYCAEGTSAADGRADETILVASIADTPVEATITVMPGGVAAPVSHTVRLAPRGEARVRVADLVQTPEPAVVVEVVGGQAVVSHQLDAKSPSTGGDIATEPCARGASPDWYFAAGTTLKGTQQFLVLFDPFGDDAIVDVTFVTDDGVQEPDSLQALVVSRRSRVTIPVHDVVPRQRNVAIHVHARTGRVVAERTQLFDGTASDGEIARDGIALSLGAEASRNEWYLPYGATADGASSVIGVANFGTSSTTIEVNSFLDGEETIAPQSLSIPAQGVITVDVSSRVPPGSKFAVTVVARDVEGNARPVVAEVLAWWPPTSASTGAATTLGATRLARRWVIAVPAANVDGVITVLNPGSQPLTTALLVFDAGDTVGPPSEPERALDAGRFAVFDLAALDAGGDHVLVVTSDRPVAVGITYTGRAGASIAAAVPDYAYGTR